MDSDKAEFEDLLGVSLVDVKLDAFMRNWDTVLSGIKVTPEYKFLEPLINRQVKKSRTTSHDINMYARAAEASKERSYMLA